MPKLFRHDYRECPSTTLSEPGTQEHSGLSKARFLHWGMIALIAALELMLQPLSGTHSNQTTDATTLHKKVLCGYQGWFRAGGDGGAEWDHWNRDWHTPPRTNALDFTFDMWPDVSEYTNKYPVPGFTHPDGSQACLYSAQDQQTVDKHFDWMQEHGIDGVVVQRFVTQTPPDNIQTWKTNVLRRVRAAANRTGRIYCLEYDMSGANTNTLFSQLTNDWIYPVHDTAENLRLKNGCRISASLRIQSSPDFSSSRARRWAWRCQA